METGRGLVTTPLLANSLRLVSRGVGWGFVTKINWHHVLFKWHLRECCFRGGLCSTQPLMFMRAASAPKPAWLKLCFHGLMLYIIISNANVFLHLDAKKEKKTDLIVPERFLLFISGCLF